jgi:hypothetical protein
MIGFMRNFACLVALLLLAGCGYTQSGQAPASESGYQWRSLYRGDIRTVAVPIFTNRDFARGVEFDLTKALIHHIEAQTPYKVVPRERADTVLEGEIVRVNLQTVSRDPLSSVPQEQLYQVVCSFVWKDVRSGRILVERRNLEQLTPFYPTLGENRWVGNQQGVERLALGIVHELQADW